MGLFNFTAEVEVPIEGSFTESKRVPFEVSCAAERVVLYQLPATDLCNVEILGMSHEAGEPPTTTALESYADLRQRLREALRPKVRT